MKPHRYFTRFVALGAAALVTCLASTGCQKDYRMMAGDAANNCSSGKYGQAAKLTAEASSKLKQDDIDRVAYLMEAGRCAQLNGDLETSDKLLGDASDEVRPYLDGKAEAKVTEGVATTALNQTVSIYRGTNLERTMLATMLAMNAMVRGDAQEARRNLILASEWQKLAADLNRKEIEEQQAEIDKAEKEAKDKQLEVPSAADMQQNEAFSNLESLNAMGAFEDPFATYLQGLFLTAQRDQSDQSEADFAWRRVASYHKGDKAIESLISGDQAVLQTMERKGKLSPTTWVVLLEGLVAHREEVKIAVVALPKMVQTASAVEKPAVACGGSSSEMVVVSDIDRLVMTDFKQKLPLIIAQEVLSTAIKTTGTAVAANQFGTAGLLVGAVTQSVTTAADLRGWHTLPKRVLVARVATPSNGEILVKDGDTVVAVARLDPDFSGVVFVDIPGKGATASVRSAAIFGAPKPADASAPQAGN